jgi:hypothetical protein
MQFVDHNKRKKGRKRKGFEKANQYIFSNFLLSTFFLLFFEYLSYKLGFVINYFVNQSKDFIKIYSKKSIKSIFPQ